MTDAVLPLTDEALAEIVPMVRRELMTRFVPPASSLIRATIEQAWPYLVEGIERCHPVTRDRDGNPFCEWCGVESPCPSRLALGLSS